ncbi:MULTISPECIES: SprT family zinc-dependent metalloprotease [unclassified Methylobacterium]|uniref:M48 family metallopeptidase n=1 Tax=unclassified Methylobacterium TaxID=2615210 RepID=UPI0006F56F00|nr:MULTISPECIES: SprT family zinc-dependent metalloprotease [unclassified Methylobacterium]KQO49985.1 metal-dependent hydrolase [Methylobacterium sp. Leaf86]KQO84776.1 metal-dependent hydrolase [Methylobacterium sp. Leaf91]
MRVALLRGSDPDHIDILHEGVKFRVVLRRRPTARRLTLRVSSATGEVVMTLPARTSLAVARTFAVSHGGWIAMRLAKVPDRVAFEAGAELPLRGVPHRILHRSERSGVTLVTEAENGPALSVACEAPHLPRRVRDFLEREVRKDLARSVSHYTEKLGQGPKRITVRDTRSRWGSCTARGELNFSWRLILAPPLVLDYLVAHEMAHLREMNHSSRFWSLVGSLCPHVEEAERWLKRNGASLHRYG